MSATVKHVAIPNTFWKVRDYCQNIASRGTSAVRWLSCLRGIICLHRLTWFDVWFISYIYSISYIYFKTDFYICLKINSTKWYLIRIFHMDTSGKLGWSHNFLLIIYIYVSKTSQIHCQYWDIWVNCSLFVKI